MRRGRYEAPTEHPLDYHDDARDHIKNDGPGASAKKRTETANPTATNEKGTKMSITQSIKHQPPRGLEPIDPTEPDSRWSAADLELSCDYVAEYDPEDDSFRVYAHGIEVGAEDIAATVNDAIRFWSRVRAVQAELANRRLDS